MSELRRNTPQTLAYVPLDALHILACPRVSVPSVLHLLPAKYIAAMQTTPNACCHDVNNLDIEAWWSCPDEKNKGTPDIYKFYCKTCDCCHVRFCVGGDHPDAKNHTPQTRPELFDVRPFWEVR